MRKVGFIGVGNMGTPFVENLLERKYSVTIYDIKEERVERLVKEGANAAKSPKGAAKESDITCTSLNSVQAVEEVILGRNGVLEGIRAGGVVIDFSTSSPLLAEKIYGEAKKKDVKSLDSPVTQGPDGIKRRETTLYVGGDKQVYEESLGFLKDIGGLHILYMGGPGKGQITKIINNQILVNNFEVSYEGLLAGIAAEVDLDKLYEAVKFGSGASYAWHKYLPDVITYVKKGEREGIQSKRGDYGFHEFTESGINKDIALAVELGHRYDVFAPHTYLTYQLMKARSTFGFDTRFAGHFSLPLFQLFEALSRKTKSRNL